MGESMYALKRKGIYPANGRWGKRMRKLDGYPELVTVRLGDDGQGLLTTRRYAMVEDPAVWREAIGHG